MKPTNITRNSIINNDIDIINNLLNYELRSNKIIHPHNENIHFKILIPCVAAGAIIGKGGEAIAIIQKESGAKVKISKSYDFYPGTTERICLIMGTVSAITQVHDYVTERIYEKPEQITKTINDNKVIIERHKQVKILVPNSTAGMIIGKSGCYIKEIKEKSGAFVQISQKSKEINLPERCVTVAGDVEQNRIAVNMILGKIDEDPHSGSCPGISYVDIIGPVASAYPTGSPYAMVTNAFNPPSSTILTSSHSACSSPPDSVSGQPPSIMPSTTPTINQPSKLQGSFMPQSTDISYYDDTPEFIPYRPLSSIETVRNILRISGFSERAIYAISRAIETICLYGLTNYGSTKQNSKTYNNSITLYDSLPLYGAHNTDDSGAINPLEFLINSYINNSTLKMDEIYQSNSSDNDFIVRDLKVSPEMRELLGPIDGEYITSIALRTKTEIKMSPEEPLQRDSSCTLQIIGPDLDNVLDAIGLLIYTSLDQDPAEQR